MLPHVRLFWEMSDDTDESPARLGSGRRRRRPRVSFPSLEALSRSVNISLIAWSWVLSSGESLDSVWIGTMAAYVTS